ncbi:MAG: recombinase family protein [Saccharofermentanales bacterium]
MARYAYMRLDANDPDTTRQASLLDGVGDFDKIFVDRAPNGTLHSSSKSMTHLAKAVAALKKGDTLYAASADRVCGQIREFIGLVNSVKEAGADFVCLDISFDTRSAASSQTLKVLKTLSDVEREAMSDRKKTGIRSARKMGRRIGRPPVSLPAGFREVCRDWAEGRISGVEAIRRSNMKSTSFYKKSAELGYVRAKPERPN